LLQGVKSFASEPGTSSQIELT